MTIYDSPVEEVRYVDAPLEQSLEASSSIPFFSTAYIVANQTKDIAETIKSYGFGEVDPVFKEQHAVNMVERVSNAATYSLLFAGIALDAGLLGGLAAPLALAGSSLFVGYTNSLEHPSTEILGLNAECNNAPLLNQYKDGHSVIVTQDSLDSFKWKKELVKSAKHSIELSGSFCAGEAFQEILSMMEDKLKENPELQIRILCTPDLLEGKDKTRLKELESAFPFNFHVLLCDRIPVTTPGISLPENHVKIIIIDEEYFIVGGSNLQESMLSSGEGIEPERQGRTILEKLSGSNWRDMDMVSKGPAAKTLRLEFYKLWAKWAYLEKREGHLVSHYKKVDSRDAYCFAFESSADKVNDVALKIVAASPLFTNNEITKEYCRLLDEAILEKKDVTIANMIFNPPEELIDKIKLAVSSGCKVTILSTNLQENGAVSNHLFFTANRDGFIKVYKAAEDAHLGHNLEIYEYNVPDGIFHKKVWLIGDDISIFSSANLGMKSHLYDDELSIVVKSKEVADKMRQILEKDKTLSKKLQYNEILSIESVFKGAFGQLLTEFM